MKLCDLTSVSELLAHPVTSAGIRSLVKRNQNIRCLFLNHCRSLDDQALYDIAYYVGERLHVIELDFLASLSNPAASLLHLSTQCRNLSQLSLAKFFNENYDEPSTSVQYKIDGINLRDVDLYGNYFITLPLLPPTVHSIRLSVNGNEDPLELVRSLQLQPYLKSINLQLMVREASITAVDNANALLCTIISYLGAKITILQVAVPRLFDDSLRLITENTPNLTHLALDVNHLSTHILQKYFSGGNKSRGSRLRSLKICRMRITYRVLFAIARGARNLTGSIYSILNDLETSHMLSIDDRFVSMLGDNCRQLRCVNFNGCKWVSDKGMAALARRCSLREVRIRGTACTDQSIYLLAQFCPELEWISYADYSGNLLNRNTAYSTVIYIYIYIYHTKQPNDSGLEMVELREIRRRIDAREILVDPHPRSRFYGSSGERRHVRIDNDIPEIRSSTIPSAQKRHGQKADNSDLPMYKVIEIEDVVIAEDSDNDDIQEQNKLMEEELVTIEDGGGGGQRIKRKMSEPVMTSHRWNEDHRRGSDASDDSHVYRATSTFESRHQIEKDMLSQSSLDQARQASILTIFLESALYFK
uniref:F-box/LRR-repeat protein n=1 Tax=Heterorhabditis bacteriophora TaxID=37862 RepID=A0A1I7WWD0_HETBA